MTRDTVLEIMRGLIWMAGVTTGPILLAGLVTGLVMGVLQSATQIQEASLTFIPKLLVVGLCLLMGGPWAVDKLVVFTGSMIEQVAHLGPGGQG